MHKWTAAYIGEEISDLNDLKHAETDFNSETDRREQTKVACRLGSAAIEPGVSTKLVKSDYTTALQTSDVPKAPWLRFFGSPVA